MTPNETLQDDWRREAIVESLRGFNNSENLDALLQAVVRRRPMAATLLVDVDRLQLLRFLQEHTQNFHELVIGTQIYERSDRVEPFTGWYALHWEGHEIEVALAPSYGNGSIVCFGTEREQLHRFAEAMQIYCRRPMGRCLRYTNGWESAPDLDREIGKVTWDDIVLAPDVILRIREAIEGFTTQREAFKSMGFTWRRGVLLIGPPGTGKTMVCKAAAASLPPEMPFLYVRDLREGKEREAIKTIFERARKLSPCLLAFEDLDGLVDKTRRTVFLNEMDGFANNEGLLIIASSNHPERIDEALLTRPSRFDRVFHLGLPDRDGRRAYCNYFLGQASFASKLATTVDWSRLAERVAELSDGFTPAYLKEAFVSAALQRVQMGATILDELFIDAVLLQIEELKDHLRKMRDPEALAEMRFGDSMIGLRR